MIAISTDILDTALACASAGMSVLPVDSSTKRPAGWLLPRDSDGNPTWAPFRTNPAGEDTIRSWFASGIKAFALITGVTGHVAIDFDVARFYDAWKEAVGDLADGLVLQKTGREGGGYQTHFRCPDPCDNLKLAWAPDPSDPTGRTIAIETRGVGGYVVAAPSLHPSGNHYAVLAGRLQELPLISQARADALLEAARKLDEAPKTRQELEQEAIAEAARQQVRSRAHLNGEASVIEQYNRRFPITDVLERHGYVRRRHRYVRPGGESESVSVHDGRSCHWSSDDPLNDSKVHSGMGVHDAFSVFCILDHGGDVNKAVKAAADLLGMKRQHVKHAPPPGRPDDETCSGAYVLTPGAHQTDQGEYIEIGTDDFAEVVISRLPRNTIYRRGDIPGEIVGEDGQKNFRPLLVDGFRMIVDGHMRLGKWVTKGRGDSAQQVLAYSPCSRDHASLTSAKAATDPRVEEIIVLTSYPVFAEGFALAAPGMHNGVYYDEPAELAGLEPETDPEVIRQVLDDLVVDFPFKDEASRQNYFGLLLTPLIRPAIKGNAPMHLIMAPLERTGKTKLAEEGLGGIITGKPAPAMQMADDDTEIDKRITSTLIRGGTLLHLDNIREFIDSASLASLLTATTYSGRILGSSRVVELPNTLTIVGTGNNIRATGEIVKRTVPICLQPATDAPELRTGFEHPDFFGYVLGNRRRLLACLIGMVQSWHRAGAKSGRMPMGGFDRWAAVVGGVLAHVGYNQWMTNAAEWRETSDPRRSDLRALVQEWHRQHGMGLVTVNELLAIAKDMELFPDVLAKATNEKGLQTSFGMKVLSRNVDTPVAGFIIRQSNLSRPATYRLEPQNREQE